MGGSQEAIHTQTGEGGLQIQTSQEQAGTSMAVAAGGREASAGRCRPDAGAGCWALAGLLDAGGR